MNESWVKRLLSLHIFNIVCGVLLGMLAMQAVAKTAEASARDKMIMLMPTANPYALPANRGKATVRFSVQVAGKNKLSVPVHLRRVGDKQSIVMNDLGKDGDLVARDGIYGVNVSIDTATVKVDSCQYYEAWTQQKRGSLKSPPLKLCVSSFPIGIAPTNTSNPAKWGDVTRAAADEVLITVAPATGAAAIRELARSIDAKVIGSILPLNFYQLKLASPASPDQLLAKVMKLRKSSGVTSASVNLLGQGALNVNDAAFDLAPADVKSQHGLKLVLGHNPPSDANAANAWDGNNRGAGVKVVVMDTGLDLTHPDLPDTWTCQLIPAPPAPVTNPTVLEIPCTASAVGGTPVRHGTLVAGVIAASASMGGAEGSGEGIAGVAFNSTIHSMKMTGFDLANQTQGFHQAAVYRGEHADALIYNASFNVLNAFAPVADVTALCGAINALVLSGTTARAIVVNSAGNNNSNGLSYPGRCNASHTGGATGTDALSALGKPLLITVANSVSFPTDMCGNGVGARASIDQLCRADIVGGTTHLGSNYGTWVDIAAPGSEIRSTTIVGTGDGGGNYVSETGTTMAAPFVSGAAAILLSCGVPISSVESVLKTSATVTVPFPDGSSAKRLDIKLATASCNQPPETNAGSGSGLEDAASIAVSLSGSDVGGSVTSFNIVSLPSNGTLSVVGSVPAVGNAATVSYTPNPNFNGTDTFTYASVDNLGLADASAATATITVIAANDPPETAAGSGSGTEDVSPISVSLSGSDIDGTVASFNIVSGPSNGTLSVVGSVPAVGNAATVSYTPNPNFNGTDTFTYASVDNLGLADASAATATITVIPVNDPPAILGQPISFTHPEYNQVNPAASPVFDDYVGDVVASDPEGDALTFIITAGNEAIVNGSTQSNAFRFDPAIPGRLLVDNRLAINFEYKPVFNLTVQVTDAGGLSASANVTVTLSNDANDNGDPHITTVRGLRYDFQSAGEFIALRGANGMEIQTRQTAIPGPAPFADPYSGLAVGVSINTAVAARVGGNRVTYQPNADGVPDLRINGNVTTLPANGLDLGVGGRVIPLGANSIQVDFPDGTVMTVSAYLWGSLSYMQIGVMHTQAREGLMGINTAGSWLPRLADGTSFGAMPSALCDRFVELYEKFANSWRVTDGNSLFDYAPGTSTSTFTSAWPLEKPICAAPSIAATPRSPAVAVAAPARRIAPVAPRGIVLKPVAKEVAQQQCRAIAGKTEKDNCVFDVMFTGNTGFAQAYQRTEKLRAGLTSVVLRVADKLNAQGEMVVIATVARHATVVPNVKGVRAVPTGAVQFMLGDKPLGKPVKLDAKGQAKLVVTRQNMERFNTGKLDISAQYQPVRDKANVFLPSISRKLTREMVRGR